MEGIIYFSMTEHPLRAYDGRTFFEQALALWVRDWRITEARIASIIADWPKGIVQIATRFDTPNKLSGIEGARDRMIGLVSLYLEHATEWDLNRAIGLLHEKWILELSRWWSELVKQITPDYEGHIDSTQAENQRYDHFARPIAWTRGGYLSIYNEHMKSTQMRWFVKDCLRVYKINSAYITMDEPWLLQIAMIIATWKSIDSEINQAIIDGAYDVWNWNRVLDHMREEYPIICDHYTWQVCISEWQKTPLEIWDRLEQPNPYEEWENIWFAEVSNNKRKITALILWFSGHDMRVSITKKRLLEILKKVYTDKTPLEKLCEYAREHTPPWEHIDTILENELGVMWKDMMDNPKPPSRILKNTLQVFHIDEFDDTKHN